MAETLSLMEFLQALLADDGLRGAFGDDPQGTLTAHGLADLTPADVHDALVLVQDTQTVDYYSLDAATAPPPPPPTGDGHEAAVEYLARYLAGPHQVDPAEGWAEPDVSSDHVLLGGFGAGDDTGYGAGSDLAADDGAWTALPPGPAPGHALDDRSILDLADFGHLEDFGEFTAFTDLPDDVPDGHDAGPPLPEGA
ncbi:IniB N-terminal domain-containing protein [Pseudonocardia cypriaca]|uniref:Uncharacterized protein n=1 Tax=Pseudonocardia cypriaca TaxID=882449 RepID=A0A543FPX4_9PSEU|nr:IniB N-terminal domain-containing protein [Pseudonocardia cypriaca]TQM35883.1 hypothetical protein FB388_7328 [Pseudonocardia cypriaca]